MRISTVRDVLKSHHRTSNPCLSVGEMIIRVSYSIFKLLHGSIQNVSKEIITNHFDSYLELLTKKINIYTFSTMDTPFPTVRTDCNAMTQLRCEAIAARLKTLFGNVAFSFIQLKHYLLWSDLVDDELAAIRVLLFLFDEKSEIDYSSMAAQLNLTLPLHVFVENEQYLLREFNCWFYKIVILLKDDGADDVDSPACLNRMVISELQTLPMDEVFLRYEADSLTDNLMDTSYIYHNASSNSGSFLIKNEKSLPLIDDAREMMSSRAKNGNYEAILSSVEGHWIHLRKSGSDSFALYTRQQGDTILFSDVMSVIESLVDQCCDNSFV